MKMSGNKIYAIEYEESVYKDTVVIVAIKHRKDVYEEF